MALPCAVRGVGSAVLAACIGAPFAGAQDAAPAPTFGTEVRVDVVDVATVVTTRAGEPITDLSRADFSVFEDGRPVEITNFLRPFPAPGGPPPGASPAAGTGGGAADASPSLSIVVVLDDDNLSVRTRRALAGRLRDGLAPLLAGGRTRAMLVSSGPALRVHQPFTADGEPFLAAFEKAIREVGAASGGAFEETVIARMLDTRQSFSQGRPGATEITPEDADSLVQETRSAAQSKSERARTAMSALATFVDSLAGLPGRTVVFLLSEGVEMRPGEALLQRLRSRFPAGTSGFSPEIEAERLSIAPQIDELVGRANANLVTVYCIDAGEASGRGERAAEDEAGPVDARITAERKGSARFALQRIAQGTGGRSLSTSGDLGVSLASAAGEGMQAYSLGFAATHAGDGKRHAIRVEVKRPGARVRHRESYVDKTPDQRAADRTTGALLHGVAANPLGVRLTGGTELAQPDGAWVVPVLVNVPIGSLTLLPEGEVHVARLSAWLAARDTAGRLHQTDRRSFTVRVPNQRLLDALGQSATTSFQLVMREGRQRVAATLRDDLGGDESTATVELDVGASAAADAAR